MKRKLYDVNFALEVPASITIEASSKEKAREIAEAALCCLSRDDTIERLMAAVAAGGLKIKSIEYVDDAE